MRKPIVPLCLIVTVSAFGLATGQQPEVARDFVTAEPHEPVPAALAAALAGIQAPALGARIAFLAAPSMEGRGLDSRGLEAASEYVAAALALAGVPPLAGGDTKTPLPGAYFQSVPIREITAFTGEVTVERRQGEQSPHALVPFGSGLSLLRDAARDPVGVGRVRGVRDP